MNTVQNYLQEYMADPNCWPELWIRSEPITDDEKEAFISQAIVALKAK